MGPIFYIHIPGYFSRGYRRAGGRLPRRWKRLARIVDLNRMCQGLSREETPAEAVEEMVEPVGELNFSVTKIRWQVF